MGHTLTLFKSLSPAQLAAVVASDWRCFFPEAPEQKIFYPKLYPGYAEQIAKRWNAPRYSAGYVVGFTMTKAFMGRYQTQTVAYEEHREYKIPIAELSFFNRNIQGRIQILSAFTAINPNNERQLAAAATSGY
ncbi:MAG: hypothetical protein V7459_13835 [Oceanicoccus sp.]